MTADSSARRAVPGPGVLIALGALAVAVLIGVVLAAGGAPTAVDRTVGGFAEAGRSGPATEFAAGLSLLGAGPVLYPVLLTVCLVTAWRRRSAWELLPVAVLAVSQMLELALFAPLDRPAPAHAPADGFGGLAGTGYGSGHTSAAVVGWGLIIWQVSRVRDRGSAGSGPGWLLWTVAALAGAMVGGARIQLGLRWPTDVLIGLLTGSTLLAAALVVLARVSRAPVPAPPESRVRPTAPVSGLWPWLRRSPWAWSVPAVAALVPMVPILTTSPDDRMKDLLVYYRAGQAVGLGEVVYAVRTEFGMPFTYPPFAAFILEPLARMPLGFAQTVWTIATLAAVVALAATVLRPVADRIGLPLTVAAVLVSSPVRSHFRFGQVGLFLVLLIWFDLLRRTRSARPAGAGVGLATALKLTPAVFLPWLAVTRQWRRLLLTVLWCGGATAAGLVLLWPNVGHYLTDALWDTTRFGANDIPGNQSVRGMLLRVLPETAAQWTWWALAVALAAAGLYQAWRCERHGNRLAAVGVLAALSVAVSPISWVHHLVFLALPMAALASAGRFRLVAGWAGLLTVSLPFVGTTLGEVAPSLSALAALVTNVQGLTAVLAILLLPALVGGPPDSRKPLNGMPPSPREGFPGLPWPRSTQTRRRLGELTAVEDGA